MSLQTANAILEATRRTIRARTMRVRPPYIPLPTGADQTTLIAKTPAGGIAAVDGSFLVASAVCAKWAKNSTTNILEDTTETVVLWNTFTTAIAGDTYVIASKIAGVWFVVAEDCPPPIPVDYLEMETVADINFNSADGEVDTTLRTTAPAEGLYTTAANFKVDHTIGQNEEVSGEIFLRVQTVGTLVGSRVYGVGKTSDGFISTISIEMTLDNRDDSITGTVLEWFIQNTGAGTAILRTGSNSQLMGPFS